MRELTITAVEVETVCGPAGRFSYPELRQVLPLDVYRSPGEPAEAGREPDPGQIVEALYLRITTRQGPQGLYGPVDPVAAWPLTQVLAPFLTGQDALAHAALWDKMQRLDRHSRSGHLKMAISAADNALWDLRGRAFDAPVWQLLGGSGRPTVPAYVSTLGAPHAPSRSGRWPGNSPRRVLGPEVVPGPRPGRRGRGDAGQHHPGRGSPGRGGPRCSADVRRLHELGSALRRRWCQAVAGTRPAWLEEPFAPGQLAAYAALRDKSTIPLAAGEHLYDRQEVLPFLSERILTVV